MIMLPPPLNAFILPFIPFILLFKNEKFNRTLLKMFFIPYYIFYNFIYIGINLLIILPICWIKYIFLLFVNIVIRKFTMHGLLYTLMWAILGYFYLLYIFCANDIVLF
jgi:hypothetical protein